MGICSSLFSGSITLAGFIAVFLVFRYNANDIRVDNRKSRIRSLLKEEIKNDPSIDIRVQHIGKDPNVNDAWFFYQKFNNKAVDSFVNNILAYRRLRNLIVWLGLASIVIWGMLSLIYLIIYVISPCPFSSISCSATLAGISIGLFISSVSFISSGVLSLIYVISSCLFNSISCPAMVIGISIAFFIRSMLFTLCFVSISLRKKPE